MNTREVVQHLKAERDRLDAVIAVLDGSGRIGQQRPRGDRHMSADARRRISEAQKRRWAKRRRAGNSAATARPSPITMHKRRGGLSAAGRKRLSEMMKKRWAERRKKAA